MIADISLHLIIFLIIAGNENLVFTTVGHRNQSSFSISWINITYVFDESIKQFLLLCFSAGFYDDDNKCTQKYRYHHFVPICFLFQLSISMISTSPLHFVCGLRDHQAEQIQFYGSPFHGYTLLLLDSNRRSRLLFQEECIF